VLEKLGIPLLLISERELASLLPYVESFVVSTTSCRSLSLEWNGFERRHFDFFSLSVGDVLGPMPVMGVFGPWSFNAGTAGVSPERCCAGGPRSRDGDRDPTGLRFTSLLPCLVVSCIANEKVGNAILKAH